MTKFNSDCVLVSNEEVARGTFAMRFAAAGIAASCLPGQFVNIRVDGSYDPLLRRPYSISNIDGELCEILYAVAGKGTAILARKRRGDSIGVIGPLGNTFGYDKKFSLALVVAGGIGVAPFPFLTAEFRRRRLPIRTYLGARTADLLVHAGLDNVTIATDDGSRGFHGNVVDCLHRDLSANPAADAMIFACGPNAMLQAVQRYALDRGMPCELSLESEMACGVGICQGCPIERTAGERKYALVCTEGPCFDARDILFHGHSHA